MSGDFQAIEDWVEGLSRELWAHTIARGIIKRMRKRGYALSAVFHCGKRSFEVVESEGRAFRERLRFQRGRLIGVYTPDVDTRYLADDVEVCL